jgi:soluble lytic murein transglycosylase-like protein
MPQFAPIEDTSNVNPLAGYYAANAQQLSNQLAYNTLGSRTQTAANEAQSGTLANQQAAQKNPLDLAILRQQAGLDPDPTVDAMHANYNNGQPVGSAPGGAAAPTGQASPGGPQAQAQVPAQYLPFYQEASARTGIPVDTLIAQGQQESSFRPNAVGKAGEIGLHQIKPSTAADPGFGMTGVDPKSLFDPRTNINFAADYLKARAGPNANFADPAARNRALQAYNGGGDPNYVAHVTRYIPGQAAPGAPQPGQQAAASPPAAGGPAPPAAAPQPTQAASAPSTDHPAQPAVQALANQIMAVPPADRPALYAKLSPTAIAAGASVPADYPGDEVIGHLAGGGWGHPSAAPPAAPNVQYASRGPMPGDTASDATARLTPSGPASAAAPGTQGVNDVMARLRAGQATAPTAAPDPSAAVAPADPTGHTGPLASVLPPGPVPPAPQNSQAPAAPARPQLMPAASAQPPAAPPATGLNSPQVQQAQQLMRQAAQIELLAATRPNDPRATATAAAMAGDLRARATVLMQADSVTTDPVTHIQTHALTGAESDAAKPWVNPARVTKVDGPNGTILTQPGSPDRVIPYSTRPFVMDMAKKDNDQIPALAQQALDQEQTIQKTIEARNTAAQIPTGANFDARSATANWLKTYFPEAAAKLGVGKDGALLPDPGTASEGAKLLTGAAQQNEKAMGGSGGLGITTMFVKNNPNLDMQPAAIRDMSNLNAVTQMANKDYLQAKISHIAGQTQNLADPNSDGSYKPTSAFEKQWFSQNNTNTYYAAVQAMNQKPYEVWSKGLSDGDKQRALGVIARIDPTSKVLGDNGHPLAVSKFMPKDMTNPSGVTAQ